MAQSTSVPPPEINAAIRYPSLAFSLPSAVPKFGPRVGRIVLTRSGRKTASTDADTGTGVTTDDTTGSITMDTPNILVGTTRGVVPHFSRDHTQGSDAIRWINVPFESFLEQVPPIPTLQDGPNPLHTFLGFDRDRHITSLCLRDPLDTREMPPNGNRHVSANCVRGVKKVTLSDWRKYVYRMQPDVVFALTDTPFTPPPYSQKRITKSIDRSAAWIADILRPPPGDTGSSRHPLNVFVHMAGGTSVPAREAFAYGLRETLHGPEADAARPLQSLDEGVSGYAFDLAVLRSIKPSPNTSQHQSLPDDFLRLESSMIQHSEAVAESSARSTMSRDNLTASGILPTGAESCAPPNIASLFKASLGELPGQKLRLVTGTHSPHEMLRLARDVGIDLFDVGWAMNAANVGIALDFRFPLPAGDVTDGRQNLGHNLYDFVYAGQFRRLADALMGAGEREDEGNVTHGLVCPCIACSPRSPSSHILHSTIDQQSYDGETVVRYEKPHSRAYLHHLLHTHEMSAHTLLVAHNIALVSKLLVGVRQVWMESGNENRSTRFALEVERFSNAYDESEKLFIAAKEDWECVDKARGKGRFAKEKEKQGDEEDG